MAPEPPALAAGSAGIAIHATAVTIAGHALIILGRSRSGKSALAFALLDVSTRAMPIRFLGDDRVLLAPCARGLMARPHPRIAGFIERRGLGIVAMAHVAAAPVRGIVALGGAVAPLPAIDPQNFPWLSFVDDQRVPRDRRDIVLDWWHREAAGASCTSHLGSKRVAPSVLHAKD